MRRRHTRPMHPGEMLRLDFLPEYRLTADQLAASLLLPPNAVESILEERTPVDADVALRLARLFGTSAEMWMAFQRDVDFFDALEKQGTSIDEVAPVDPTRSASQRDSDPLPEDLLEQLREQVADIKDDTRWVICSAVFEDDPQDDDFLASTYYEVGSDCWAVGIEHGTAFKRERAAQAVAAGLREGVRVIAVEAERLERAAHEEAADLAVRKRYLRRSRRDARPWPSSEILRSEDDMAAYLEMAAEEHEPALLSDAVKDVLSAMREQCHEA